MSEPQDFEVTREQAVTDPNLPNLYFNGFILSISGSGDAIIVLQRNQRPIAILNTPYTIAKTLQVKMQSTLAGLEQAIGSSILTTDEIQNLVRKHESDDH